MKAWIVAGIGWIIAIIGILVSLKKASENTSVKSENKKLRTVQKQVNNKGNTIINNNYYGALPSDLKANIQEIVESTGGTIDIK